MQMNLASRGYSQGTGFPQFSFIRAGMLNRFYLTLLGMKTEKQGVATFYTYH